MTENSRLTVNDSRLSDLELSLQNQTLDLSTPQIMGILNTTPDSFSDGGQFNTLDAAFSHISQMIKDGADIIDVGGESTRPGAEPVSEQQEMDRVIPVLEQAISAFPDVFFSVDTTRYTVAEEALKRGAHIINDVSGLQKEPRLAELAAKYDAGYILMHSLWPPKTMQEDPRYDDVIEDIKSFFKKQLKAVHAAGLKNIILDPGFGFGKTDHHNFTILNHIEAFCELGYPVVIGASRKATIGNVLNDRPVDDRVAGTVAAHYHALIHGANILRVHDVKEAKDSVRIFEAIARKVI